MALVSLGLLRGCFGEVLGLLLGPKIVPSAPKSLQDRPKIAQEGLKRAPREFNMALDVVFFRSVYGSWR